MGLKVPLKSINRLCLFSSMNDSQQATIRGSEESGGDIQYVGVRPWRDLLTISQSKDARIGTTWFHFLDLVDLCLVLI